MMEAGPVVAGRLWWLLGDCGAVAGGCFLVLLVAGFCFFVSGFCFFVSGFCFWFADSLVAVCWFAVLLVLWLLFAGAVSMLLFAGAVSVFALAVFRNFQ